VHKPHHHDKVADHGGDLTSTANKKLEKIGRLW